MKIKILLIASLLVVFLSLCIASAIPDDGATTDNSAQVFVKEKLIKDTFNASEIDSEMLDISKNEDGKVLLKNARIDTGRERISITTANAVEEPVNSGTESYYIVQFRGSIKDEWKTNLENNEALVLGYVPNNAYLVKMNSSVKSNIESLDHIQWIGEYKAEYKISPELQKSAQETEDITKDIIVILFEPEDKQKVCEDIKTIGGEIVDVSGEVIRIRIETSRIPEIAAIDGVKWIEEYVQPVIFNNVSRDITGVSYVSDTFSLKGNGQIIGIADTGLDTGINDISMHDDFEGRIVNIFDLVGDGSADQDGHGTHVAGSVLGEGSMSGGNYTGMAPEAGLVFQAVAEDTFGSIVGIPPDLTQLFQQSYDEGARIHTNSWGKPVYGNYDSLSYYTDKFMWEHPDMLILFAAGNYGKDSDLDGVVDLDSISSPATAKNCISVGASENYRPEINSTWDSINHPINPIADDKKADDIEGIAAFSSRGPTNDGRLKPDIVAPGTFIASTRSSKASTSGWGVIDENYLYMGGTSMATPITAGSAALVRQNYMDNLNTTPSAALIKATIINGAHDMTPGQYGMNSTQEIEGKPDYSQGWGRLDIKESLYPSGERKIHFTDKVEVNTGESFENEYYIVNSSQPLRVTLVWTDYPAEPYASVTLVNDLDLYVIGPDGKYYKETDGINNVEQIEIQSPQMGQYTVVVDGFNVPQGPQPFALVLSGATGDLAEPVTLEFAPEYPFITVGENTVFHSYSKNQYGLDIDADVEWSSSNTGIGTIDESTGEFTALSVGKTNITASVSNLSATAEITVTEALSLATVFAYGDEGIELRSPLFKGNNLSEIVVSTDYDDFPWFYYNLDQGSGTERIYVNGSVTDPRTIDFGSLKYQTQIKESEYSHKEWGTFTSIGFMGDLNVMISSPGNFTDILLDNNDAYTLEQNGSIDLEDGYFLEIVEIDTQGNNVLVSLKKDGNEVDNSIISSNSDYVYEKDIGIFNDISIVKVHFNEIVTNNETDTVIVQGMFQISDEIVDIELNDDFGEFHVISIEADHIELANKEPITLENGSTINLTEEIKIKVADSQEIRFYFINSLKDTGSYEIRGITANSSASNNHRWDPTSFSGFHYNLLRDVLSESLDITTVLNNRTIEPDALEYKSEIKRGSYNYVPWNEDEKYFKIGFFGEEKVVRSIGNAPLLYPDKLYELILNDDKKYVLRTGQILDLGKGYTLEAKLIDTADKEVLLEFARNGEPIEENVVYENNTWKYSTQVDGYSNIEILRVHVARVYQIDTVEIEGIWLMSNESEIIEVDDVFGNLSVKAIGIDSITLKNDNPIVLESGNDIEIANSMVLKVAESPDTDIRFYPFMESTISNETRTIKVEPEIIDLVEGDNYNFTAQALDMHQNILDVTINWNSSNEAIGTINKTTGEFSAKAAGSTTITATCEDGIKGTATVSVAQNTTSDDATSQSSGGGGGGGGGSTGEAYDNIEKKEVVSQFVNRGEGISYNFDEEENSIDYIKFDSLKNSGKISVTIEVLKNRSQLVNSDPSGEVYQQMNIWVGKTGFAIPENIDNPVIGFTVKRSWVEENNIIGSSIKMCRNHEGQWDTLATQKVGEDEEYIYFESQTSGFSPFAITGETEEIDELEESTSETENIATEQEQQSPETENRDTQTENNTLPGFSTIGSFLVIIVASLFINRRRK